MVWDGFATELCQRFGKSSRVSVVKEFNKLSQLGSVVEYQDHFEELRSRMLTINPTLDEEYFRLTLLVG